MIFLVSILMLYIIENYFPAKAEGRRIKSAFRFVELNCQE